MEGLLDRGSGVEKVCLEERRSANGRKKKEDVNGEQRKKKGEGRWNDTKIC